ncbi:MAG: hypothetical protein LBV15_03440, partial [Planctomycetota bacterium]|nr:hypothetical protein [Planctomycetota bacterium]
AAYDDYLRELRDKDLSEPDIEALARNDAVGFLRQAAEGLPEKTVLLAKRLIKDVFSLANSTGQPLDESRLSPLPFRRAVLLLEEGRLNGEGFRQTLEALYTRGGEAEATAREADLLIQKDDRAVEKAIAKTLAEVQPMVAEYRAGKAAVRNAIFGRVMKELNKKGDPKMVGALLDAALGPPGQG